MFSIGDEVVIHSGVYGKKITVVESISPTGQVKVKGSLIKFKNENGVSFGKQVMPTIIRPLTKALFDEINSPLLIDEIQKLLKNEKSYDKLIRIREILKNE